MTDTSHVDHLFGDAAQPRGQLCKNPVTGENFVSGDDPISQQKRMACNALLARQWFIIYGPHGAPPLPLSDEEIQELKYCDPLSYIFSCFAYSLRANNWDFNTHPKFERFACGVMASEHTPDFVKKDEALRKRYPPCPLPDLNRGNCWDPPVRHAQTKARHRCSMARCK